MEMPIEKREALKEFFQPPFKVSIKENGFTATMSSHSDDMARFTVEKDGKNVYEDFVEYDTLVDWAESKYLPWDDTESLSKLVTSMYLDWVREEDLIASATPMKEIPLSQNEKDQIFDMLDDMMPYWKEVRTGSDNPNEYDDCIEVGNLLYSRVDQDVVKFNYAEREKILDVLDDMMNYWVNESGCPKEYLGNIKAGAILYGKFGFEKEGKAFLASAKKQAGLLDRDEALDGHTNDGNPIEISINTSLDEISDAVMLPKETLVATAINEANNLRADIVVRGETAIYYEDECYHDFSAFPYELQSDIRQHGLWGTNHEADFTIENSPSFELTVSDLDGTQTYASDVIDAEFFSRQELADALTKAITHELANRQEKNETLDADEKLEELDDAFSLSDLTDSKTQDNAIQQMADFCIEKGMDVNQIDDLFSKMKMTAISRAERSESRYAVIETANKGR